MMITSTDDSRIQVVQVSSAVIAIADVGAARSLSYLSRPNGQHASRHLSPIHQAESQVAYALARIAAGRILGIPADKTALDRNKHGALQFQTSGDGSCLKGLSVSHSEGLAVAAADTNEIGIDIEREERFESVRRNSRLLERRTDVKTVSEWVRLEALLKFNSSVPVEVHAFVIARHDGQWTGALAQQMKGTEVVN